MNKLIWTSVAATALVSLLLFAGFTHATTVCEVDANGAQVCVSHGEHRKPTAADQVQSPGTMWVEACVQKKYDDAKTRGVTAAEWDRLTDPDIRFKWTSDCWDACNKEFGSCKR